MSNRINNESLFCFSNDNLQAIALSQKKNYENAQPFPSIVLDDFLPRNVADRVLEAFPQPSDSFWLDWTKRDTVHQPKKLGIGHALRLEGANPYLQHILAMFNSFPFLNFLESLTGINNILPDPYFNGGGIHQTLSGGKLAVHTDFNYLEALGLYRRINVIFYLNKDWEECYQGHLELWDKDKMECVSRIAPIFNRMAIFTTNKSTFHGHPVPLNTPEDITRKSLALYYYTTTPVEGEVYDRKTIWLDT